MQKGFFMRKFLGLQKPTTREICTLALLTAICAVLALTATVRIGNYIKIPFKFIAIYVTAVFFGPVWAGVSAALGDILNAFLSPVGDFLPQITLIEFIGGFLYGLTVFNLHTAKSGFITRVLLCTALQTALDMFITPIFLVQVGIFPTYRAALAIRLAAALIKATVQAAVMLCSRRYLILFSKYVRKQK